MDGGGKDFAMSNRIKIYLIFPQKGYFSKKHYMKACKLEKK